jgi:hypothetical protein
MELKSQVTTCENCQADFSNPRGWKPLLMQPTGTVKTFTKKIQPHQRPTGSKADKLVGALFVGFLVFQVLFWMIFYINFRGAGGR